MNKKISNKPRNRNGLIRTEREIVAEMTYFEKLSDKDKEFLEIFIENFYNGRKAPTDKQVLSEKEIKKIASDKTNKKLKDMYSICVSDSAGNLEMLPKYLIKLSKNNNNSK